MKSVVDILWNVLGPGFTCVSCELSRNDNSELIYKGFVLGKQMGSWAPEI